MKNSKTESQEEIEQKAKNTLNYNDRLDGYGYGEADEKAESDPTKEDEEDDSGQDKKYGPVDQYSFRVPPIGEEHQSEEKTERDINQNP